MIGRHQMPVEEGERFYARWRPALIAFFSRRVRDRSEAEDLTHDALARALESGQGPDLSDGYVFQIAQNLLIDRARRHKVRESYATESRAVSASDVDPIDPARILESQQQVAMLMAVLDELPERTRTIFTLYRLEKMPQQMIGEAFGISASAVKQQVAKAMAILAKRLRSDR